MNRRSSRINKKKAIPLHFQRSHSSSQFLVTAQHKHQIKTLKKTNRELAYSLQDAKCRLADQERALVKCNRESTQMMFVKLKVKDIVETVQKLVTDLGEVYDVIDGKSFEFLKNCSASHQEARLQICHPSISTIEESASMSNIEPDLSKEENQHIENSTEPARIKLPTTTPFFDADSSQTEIYNVPLALTSQQKLQNVSNGNQNAVARPSKSLERTGSFSPDPGSPSTPETPVFLPNFLPSIEPRSLVDLPKLKTITSQASFESQRSANPPKLQLTASPLLTKNTVKSTISKIPIKKPVSENNSPYLAVPSSHMNRRKTFVVDEKVEEPPMSLPVPDRRGTFVLKSLADNNKPDPIFDRRTTYFIPAQPEKQPDSSPLEATETRSPVQNAVPNQTILLCEDMELTEIVPHQFIPTVPPSFKKLETKEPGLSEKLPAVSTVPEKNKKTTDKALIAEGNDQKKSTVLKDSLSNNQFIPTVSPSIKKLETKESGLREKLSAVSIVPEKNKQTSDKALIAEGNDGKKSTVLKDSLSNNQPAADKPTVKEDAETPKTDRRSSRKQVTSFNKFFSDSSESDIDLDLDFIPEKRFSLQPGRKIINPNNKKVFVFKKNPIKLSSDEGIPSDLCSNASLDEDKSDTEKDVFNFSTSSEAGKSPLKKQKKRKSVMPKSNKCSVNKHFIDDKILPKRKSKRSSKQEVNEAEVPVSVRPRKSILCLNKDNSSLPLTQNLLSNRKSVRFTLVGGAPQVEIDNPNFDSPSELNATPAEQKSNDIHNTEKESSRISQGKRLSGKKKTSSARSTLKATGDVLKRTSTKLKKSRKRESCNLSSDSPEDVCESDHSPKKKMCQVSDETPPQKIEVYPDLSCGKQEQSKDVKDKFEHSQGMSGVLSSEVLEEKPAVIKKEKNSGGILSRLPPNLDANVKITGTPGKIKGKRTFSGVSERRSSKKEYIVDDLCLDLDDAVSKIVDKKVETSIKLVKDVPIEACNIKEMAKFVEIDCKKGNSVNTKTPREKNDRGKKKSLRKKKTGSGQSEGKENTPNNPENLKLDILTTEHNLCTIFGSKESIEKLVKPKMSRKKKELAPLFQKDLKTDDLTSENLIVADVGVTGRSRRSKPVISLKEPSVNRKMRRD